MQETAKKRYDSNTVTTATTPAKKGFFRRAWEMYRDGFRTMTWGRTLWILMLVKVFIMFAVLKAFFFPNFLSSKADTEEGKTQYVTNELIERSRQ